MDARTKQSFMDRVSKEPFAGILDIRLIEVDEGYEAFEISSNSRGLTAVALNVNVTYLRPAVRGNTLRATSSEISEQARSALYQIVVEDSDGVVAVCQALAHRKKEQRT